MSLHNPVVVQEEEYFSLSGYVEAPGYITYIPRGYFVRRRGTITYIARFQPWMFYGAGGQRLGSWRQFIGKAGEHVLLERRGGRPRIPSMYWRAVARERRLDEAVEAELAVDRKLLEGATIIFTFFGGLAAYHDRTREMLVFGFLALGSGLMSLWTVGESFFGLPSLRKE